MTVFSKIVAGEITCYKVAEDENFLAFLDINPLVEGHTLVIPKKEVDYIFDLDSDTYSGLMVFARKVAKAIKSTIDCKRVGVAVLGMEVPHAHIHLVPLRKESDLNFSNPKIELTNDEMNKIANKISSKVVDF